MNEVFKRTAFLEINEYPRDWRDCVLQAINELVSNKELRDIYNMCGITFNEYVEDMCSCYLRYKQNELSQQWK